MSSPAGVPRVLFVCVQNAGRSQMAEALFTAGAAGRAIGVSAGSAPAEAVHPGVIASMAEVGIDLNSRTPRHFDDVAGDRFDLVVTMGCGDECPYIPGARYEDWAVADPSDRPLDEVAKIRDEIGERVDGLLGELFG